jgi:hypothetical protein
LHPLPNIIRVIKSRRLKCVRNAASMEEIRNAKKIIVGNLESRDYLGDLGTDGR